MIGRATARGHWTRLGAGLTAIALAILLGTGTAIASGPYTVHLALPRSVEMGAGVMVKATGSSRARSRLTVFLDAGKCAASAAAESRHSHASRVIKLSVAHRFAKSHTFTASAVGKQYACAYLNAPPSRTRARATASFTVVRTSRTPPPNVNACTLLSTAEATQVMGNGDTAAAGSNPNGDASTCNWYPTTPDMPNDIQVELQYHTMESAGDAKAFADEYDECQAQPQQVSGQSYAGYYDAYCGALSSPGVWGQIGATVVGLTWTPEGDSSVTPPAESLLESDVSKVFAEVGQ